MIPLSDHPEGVLLPVKAQAGASSSGIRGEQHGALKVAVTQVAERGKANKALVEALAEGLGLKRSQIELASGPTNAQKVFLVRGVTKAELAERIDRALGG